MDIDVQALYERALPNLMHHLWRGTDAFWELRESWRPTPVGAVSAHRLADAGVSPSDVAAMSDEQALKLTCWHEGSTGQRQPRHVLSPTTLNRLRDYLADDD
jgi:uncharacterized protein YjiS (DUF1127 family)